MRIRTARTARTQPPAGWGLPTLSALLVGLAAALAVFRAWRVEQVLEGVSECRHCFFWQALGSDLWLVALIAALGAIALWTRSAWLKLSSSVAMLVLLLSMAADLVIFNSLSMRLQFGDVGKFGTEWPAIHRFLMVYSHGTWPWLLGLAAAMVGIVLWVALKSRSRYRRTAAVLALLSAASVVSANLRSGDARQYVHDTEVRNWLAVNWDQGVARPYSPEFIARVGRNATEPRQVCGPGLGRRPNIILVVVESLSAYQSALLGGRGWTPRTDAIARQGAWFTGFHANGFTTDHGLIALLTGRAPLPAVGRYGSAQAYDGFESAQGTLPTRLAAAGYTTHFFTTGDLRFLEKGTWCKQIGFEHVEGAEHPYYADMPRLHFNAAPDSALFSRFMAWRGESGRDKPYFATLLTVSSHPPFLDPERHSRSEEAVIRYVDRQIGEFHRQLREAGFFKDGVLIITGDHRAMTPVTQEESRLLGERALSRVPFIVLGDGGPASGPHEALGQQADLVNSVAALVDSTSCRAEGRGVFLGPRVEAPRYVIHVRGDKRSWLSVYMPGQDGIVRLDGDRTAWEGAVPPSGEAILSHINRERIRLGVARQDALDYIIQLKEGRRAF